MRGLSSARTGTGRDVFRARPAVGRRLRVLLAVALGGGLGSVARYGVGALVPAGLLPWGTFLSNVSGCFALGLLMVFVLEVWPPRRYVRPFLCVGFLGGFTTFSSVTVEIVGLPAPRAAAYAVASLAAGLTAVWLGMTLARAVARRPRHRAPREEA